MIQVSYPIIQSKIKINGFLSSPITVIQGVHQGYPLSLLLFIIAAKVLAIFIDWAVAYKNRLDKPGRIVWSQFFIKILGVHFVNSVLDNNKCDKINYKLTKR